LSEKPAFIQGLFAFQGQGLEKPIPFGPPVTYQAPFDKRAQMIYFRAGNSSGELIYLVLLRGSKPVRYFPVGAKSSVHVPLAVVEDLSPETKLEVLVGAPAGTTGSVVLDMGLMEIG
jgi:hypothetical protein